MRFALIVPVLAVLACVPQDEKPHTDAPDASDCGAHVLQHLVGQPAMSHDFAKEGRPLRILPPGAMMTMDHRTDRLNVDLDEQGLITRIWCG